MGNAQDEEAAFAVSSEKMDMGQSSSISSQQTKSSIMLMSTAFSFSNNYSVTVQSQMFQIVFCGAKSTV